MVLWAEWHLSLKALLQMKSLVGKYISFVLRCSSFVFLHLE